MPHRVGCRPGRMSIELTRGKHFVARTTLWGDEFHVGGDDEKKADASSTIDPEAEIFREMAVAAAAWAEFELVKDLGKSSELRTENALSWAQFQAGRALQHRELNERAVVLYREALDSDATNAGALANLGFLLWMEGKTDEARSLLEKALARYESPKGIPRQVNPDWYRVKFNLAGLHANLGTVAADGGRSEFAIARATAEELVVLGMREVLRRPRKNFEEEELEMIEEIVNSSLTVFAAAGAPAAVGPGMTA